MNKYHQMDPQTSMGEKKKEPKTAKTILKKSNSVGGLTFSDFRT